jgi:hypothetical protein
MSNCFVIRYAMENSDITYPITGYIFDLNIMIDPKDIYYTDYENSYVNADSYVYLVIKVK